MEFTTRSTTTALSTTPLFQDDERIRLLFAHIKSMVNDCFHSLYEVVCTQFVEPREQRERFAKGLQFVCDEMRQNHNYSEITRAVTSFPSIDKNYKKAMHRFIEHTLGPNALQRQHVARIECRTFEAFLFELYRRVAASVEMRTCRYFTMTYSEQEVFLKDVLRMTMSACVTVIDNANANANASANAPTLRPDDSVSNIFHFAGGNRAPPTPEEVQRSFERAASSSSSSSRSPSIAAAAASVATAKAAAAPATTTKTKTKTKTRSRLLIVNEEEDEEKEDKNTSFSTSSSLSTLIRRRQPQTPTHAYAATQQQQQQKNRRRFTDDDDDDDKQPPPPPPPPSSRARSCKSRSSSNTKEFEIGVYSAAAAGAAGAAPSTTTSRRSRNTTTTTSRVNSPASSSVTSSAAASRIPLNLETDLSVMLSRSTANNIEAAASELVFLR